MRAAGIKVGVTVGVGRGVRVEVGPGVSVGPKSGGTGRLAQALRHNVMAQTLKVRIRETFRV